ncbi:MAG TPA: helix-turn-helix domain-containing protein [Pontiellaceae bacterium]|nr:helix-turn-helix domain-containing protein [Pontiellaceae bacterium]HPR82302.1 helix-turn-helix domain-containing protein [Pontiellaceae bacterium]
MPILSEAILKRIGRSYRSSYTLDVLEVLPSGICEGRQDTITNLPVLVNARANGLTEAVRWGEPYIFFLIPNVISWIVPIVKETEVLGGLLGGTVIADSDPYDQLETINHLTTSGCPRKAAEQYVKNLPVWNDRERPQKAAEFLFALTCCELNWDMLMLSENRKKALRQRQIAEEIHRRKQRATSRTLIDEERTLLSLMKAGDQKGARRELNKTLGALFSHTADIRLIKAHVVEMMGYLVRSALEESPHMSSLIEKNHAWMTKIIDAADFETLSDVVADALDDFMRNIYLQGHSRTNETVAKLLNYLGDNFHQNITLETLAKEVGLSTFRIAHLVKEVTGKTVLQHVHQLRVQEAQRLLEQSDMNCTDIAYETGFGDQSYFIKQFRKWMGITPARYRRLYRSGKSGQETA